VLALQALPLLPVPVQQRPSGGMESMAEASARAGRSAACAGVLLFVGQPTAGFSQDERTMLRAITSLAAAALLASSSAASLPVPVSRSSSKFSAFSAAAHAATASARLL